MKSEATSRKWHFEPEFNLGHIFQIAALITTIAVFAIRTDRRFTIMEMRQEQIDGIVKSLQEQNKLITESQTVLVRSQDRLTLILDALKETKIPPKP